MLEVEFGASPAAPTPPTTSSNNSVTNPYAPVTTAATEIASSQASGHPRKKHTISDCLVVGQAIKDSNGATVDERVILFVTMPEGGVVDHDFVKAVNGEIRRKRTARHVPAEVRSCSYGLYTLKAAVVSSDVRSRNC